MQIKTRTGIDAHDAILSAARQVLRVQGASGLTIPRVAERLGVTRPAVYHHFASREVLRDAVLRPVLEDGLRLVRKNQGDRAALISGVMDFAHRHRDVILSCFTTTPAAERSDIDTEFAALRRELEDALGPRASGDENARRVAMFLAACAAGVMAAESPLPPDTRNALAALLGD